MMSYEQRVAQGLLVLARVMIDARDPTSALYWAFIAGQRTSGRDYPTARREAAALGLMPSCLLDSDSDAAEAGEAG